MPNIKQQKKRVRTAAEERLENLRYRSTIKTLAKRLSTAVEEGDQAVVADEHRSYVQWVDRAVTRGALHRNTAARKKSQAAKLAAAGGARPADAVPAAKTATTAAKAAPSKAAPSKAAPSKAAPKAKAAARKPASKK